jgi:hypothetical protein
MNKWYWWALGGAIAAIGAFFYISSKRKGGAPDQLAAARQARLDKLANEKAAPDEPSSEAAS